LLALESRQKFERCNGSPIGLALSSRSPSLDMMTARISDGDNKEDILKVFRLFDDDDSGAITLNDLLRVARELSTASLEARKNHSTAKMHPHHVHLLHLSF
jgi:hypothetical protein